MKLNKRQQYVVAAILLCLLCCLTLIWAVSSRNIVNIAENRLSRFPEPETVLLYEQSFTSSSFAGSCIGGNNHRWYGTNLSFDEVLSVYVAQLTEDGWMRDPDYPERVWRTEERANIWTMGEYSFAIFDYSDEVASSENGRQPQLYYYTIPPEVFSEMENFRTVYFVSMYFVTSNTIRRCYEH
jgi:hypothetical protein